jgi:hypothetical protein
MSIDGTVAFTFAFNDRRTVSTGTSANLQTNPSNASATYSNGTAALQANQVYGDNRTFSGSTDTLDLLTGLADSYGTNVTLARVKAIFILNTGTSSITVGAGTDPWATLFNAAGTVTLPAGAGFCAFTPDATGWTTTASTGMNLNVTGTSGQTYEVAVVGGTS